MGIREAKEEIRRAMRERRGSLDPEWVKRTSRAICRRAMSLRAVRGARVVACYLAMKGEVGTDAAIAACRAKGKRVCAPALRRARQRYELAWLDRAGAIAEGPWHVPEPADREWISEKENVDVVLAPGLAFDPAGGRLGRGGGHYDKLLRMTIARQDKCPGNGGERGTGRPFCVGVAFEFQVVGRLPTTEKDVGMDAVVTEKRIIMADSRIRSRRSRAGRMRRKPSGGESECQSS